MARKVNAIFTGSEVNEIRPGSYATDADMGNLAGDQAGLYETITNKPVPGSPSLGVIAPHDHSRMTTLGFGTLLNTGAPVRIGLVSNVINAGMPLRSNDVVAGEDLYTPIYWSPCYIPPGTDTVRVVLTVPRAYGTDSVLRRIRLRVGSGTPQNYLPTPYFRFHGTDINSPVELAETVNEYQVVQVTIADNENSWALGGTYFFKIECYDGTAGYYQDSPQPPSGGEPENLTYVKVYSVLILPIAKKPLAMPYRYEAPVSTNSTVTTPAEYQPVEEDMVDVSKSINSAVCTFSARNDPLMFEVLTGRPAGNFAEADLTHNGHNHANWDIGSAPLRGGTTTLDDTGKDVSFNLGTWSYGTMRPYATFAAGDQFIDADCRYNDGAGSLPPVAAEANVYTGAVIAPVLSANNGITNTYASISQHTFRLPANTDDNIGLGAGLSRIQAKVMVYQEGAGTCTVELRLFDEDGANGGTAQEVTSLAAGRNVLTFAQLHCATNATGNGDVQKIRLRIKKDTDATKFGVYGFTLFYVAP